jgi:hypothetical protein
MRFTGMIQASEWYTHMDEPYKVKYACFITSSQNSLDTSYLFCIFDPPQGGVLSIIFGDQ